MRIVEVIGVHVVTGKYIRYQKFQTWYRGIESAITNRSILLLKMKGLKRDNVRLMLVIILVINALGNIYFLSLHHMIFKDDTERMSCNKKPRHTGNCSMTLY